MPQKKKISIAILKCRSCGSESERIVSRGRPPLVCEPCKKQPAKNPRHGIKRKNNQHRGGKGNVKLRECGCPSRKHRESCPKSRPFTKPNESDANARIAWVNKKKKERKTAARKKQAAKLLALMKDHSKSMQKVGGQASLQVYISCVRCNARGLLRDFDMWDRSHQGICKNCKN